MFPALFDITRACVGLGLPLRDVETTRRAAEARTAAAHRDHHLTGPPARITAKDRRHEPTVHNHGHPQQLAHVLVRLAPPRSCWFTTVAFATIAVPSLPALVTAIATAIVTAVDYVACVCRKLLLSPTGILTAQARQLVCCVAAVIRTT
jgi:hypothetical protein